MLMEEKVRFLDCFYYYNKELGLARIEFNMIFKPPLANYINHLYIQIQVFAMTT